MIAITVVAAAAAGESSVGPAHPGAHAHGIPNGRAPDVNVNDPESDGRRPRDIHSVREGLKRPSVDANLGMPGPSMSHSILPFSGD
ncbi:MAG TPA: hypothetical protein VIU11_03345 [Nakamurella sp.]